ncbi:MAG: DUF1727 domain-containing protein [Clostridia bacterium]|nr:DUF1727 domain-containing protein [Clostridia bacterium]
MDKLRFYVAMAAAKLSAVGLRLLGRNASYLPGLIAVTICKNFIGHLQKPETLICVTGTNGKTTTSNLLNTVLTNSGEKVTNNSFGSNVQGGVAAALLLNSTFTGKPKNRIAVLEVDERSSLLVYPFMAPDYLICNNIMRDSIKRNAHTDFISYIINSAVPETTKVILNADDIIGAQLCPQCEKKVFFGVDALPPAKTEGMTARDIVYCPKCGGKLEAEYLRYNHIGRWRCADCGFASPARDYVVTDVDKAAGTFTVAHGEERHSFKLVNDNIVNVFNFCGAIALLREMGVPYETIETAFQDTELVKTRYDHIEAGKLHITRILAKGQNPVAVSRTFSYTAKCPGDKKCLLLIIDDKEDNIHNVESTCWLYDLDYTPLKDPTIDCMIFAGKRCKDHVLRAAMSGVDLSKIVTTDEVKNCSALVDTQKYQDIYLLFENYWLDEALAEEKLLVARGESGT